MSGPSAVTFLLKIIISQCKMLTLYSVFACLFKLAQSSYIPIIIIIITIFIHHWVLTCHGVAANVTFINLRITVDPLIDHDYQDDDHNDDVDEPDDELDDFLDDDPDDDLDDEMGDDDDGEKDLINSCVYPSV